MAAPLDVAWHYEALAGFLADPVALDETRAVRAWGDIAERIVRGREVEALAAALLDDRLRSAPNSAIETLARADAIDARVVALARDARNGDRGALRELVVLALEYHAKVELFDRALRWLFPIEINARIHARFPPDRPLEFLDALRAEFERCTFSTERGWSLASG